MAKAPEEAVRRIREALKRAGFSEVVTRRSVRDSDPGFDVFNSNLGVLVCYCKGGTFPTKQKLLQILGEYQPCVEATLGDGWTVIPPKAGQLFIIARQD